jgi:hypothetical protein
MSALCAFGGAVDPLLSRKRGQESYGRPAAGHVEAHPEPRPGYNRVATQANDAANQAASHCSQSLAQDFSPDVRRAVF